MLESMAPSTEQMASREELQAATDEAKPRPRANLEAQRPEDIYPLESLISPEELRAVSVLDWQEAAKSSMPVTTRSRFVSRRLERVALSGDVKTLKALRYLLLLLDFLSALKPGKSGKRLPPRDDLREAVAVQDILLDAVRKKYSDGRYKRRCSCRGPR